MRRESANTRRNREDYVFVDSVQAKPAASSGPKRKPVTDHKLVDPDSSRTPEIESLDTGDAARYSPLASSGDNADVAPDSSREVRKRSTLQLLQDSSEGRFFWKRAFEDFTRTSKSSAEYWPMVYEASMFTVAVCVYIVRLATFLYQGGHGLQELMTVSFFAASYLVVGVIMPYWSYSLGCSAPMGIIQVHRQRFKDWGLPSTTFRLISNLAIVFGPICTFLTCIAPAHVCMCMIGFDYSWLAGHIYNIDVDTLLIALSSISFLGFAGKLAFSSGTASDIAVDASMLAILGLILEICPSAVQARSSLGTMVAYMNPETKCWTIGAIESLQPFEVKGPRGRSNHIVRYDGSKYKISTGHVHSESSETQLAFVTEFHPDDWWSLVYQGDLSTADLNQSRCVKSKQLKQHHLYVHMTLAKLWSLECVGGLWLCRIATLFGGSLAFSARSLAASDLPLRLTLIVGGVTFAALGICLVLQLAAITNMCQNRTADSCSVISAVYKSIFLESDEYDDPSLDFERDGARHVQDESYEILQDTAKVVAKTARSQEQNAFLDYVIYSNMGIQLCGVPVNYQLVINLAKQMLLYLPVALSILAQFLRPEASESE